MKHIVVLEGDGIGPEIISQAMQVLDLMRRSGVDMEIEEGLVGAAAYEHLGQPYPQMTQKMVGRADAVLFGCVGDARLDHLGPLRPDMAIGALRRQLSLYASLRPIRIPREMTQLSPLRHEIVADVDLTLVRELGGDVYFGTPRGQRSAPDGPFVGQAEGYDTMRYAEGEVERVLRLAFELALVRRKCLVSVDKANILETSRLWRQVAIEVGGAFPAVESRHLYADNVAMQLITNPRQFDVIVTGNLFGDILSDIATVLGGSVGLFGACMLGGTGCTLYEPGHGSALDIAGQDRANPIAAIRCVGLMMAHTFGRADLGDLIEGAVVDVLRRGLRTAEIHRGEGTLVGTAAMGRAIVGTLEGMLA